MVPCSLVLGGGGAGWPAGWGGDGPHGVTVTGAAGLPAPPSPWAGQLKLPENYINEWALVWKSLTNSKILEIVQIS